MRIISTVFFASLFVLGLTACDGGGGGSDDGYTPPAPVPLEPVPLEPAPLEPGEAATNDFVVYEAEGKLYTVSRANPSVSTQLNEPLFDGDRLGSFQLSADGSRVVYSIVRDGSATQIYAVELANPGGSTKLTGPILGAWYSFEINADGSRVVYRADKDANGYSEIYFVEFAHPDVSTKLVENQDYFPFWNYKFSLDGLTVIYQYLWGELLYAVELDNPGIPTTLTPSDLTPSDDEVIVEWRLSADGKRVVYRKYSEFPAGIPSLYTTVLGNPGVSTKLNGPLVEGGGISMDFEISADGSRVVYLADQDTDSLQELYTVEFASPGASIKLNGPLVGGIRTFELSANGSQVIYLAAQDTENVDELYAVELANPGVSAKLNGPLVDGGQVASFDFSADGSRVVYGTADQYTDDIQELYAVDLAYPGVSTKLAEALPVGWTVNSFKINVDGSWLVYDTSLNTGEFDFGPRDARLYAIELADPGVSKELYVQKDYEDYGGIIAYVLGLPPREAEDINEL